MAEPNVTEGLPAEAIPVADVTKVFPGRKVAGVCIRPGEELQIGDKIFFIRKDTGDWDSIVADSIELNHKKVKVANAGEVVGVYIGASVERKSTIYRMSR